MLAFSQLVLEPAEDSIGGFVGAVEAAEVVHEHGHRWGMVEVPNVGRRGGSGPVAEPVRASAPDMWLVFTGFLPDSGSWWFR
ncbi:hypothetical protein ACFWYA_05625 [Streptomyces sp. NPDC059011]|uniref:hypothetical protein n=1 Tax=unclassified Streptomyces TaxID=2593676 RepID=UPI00369A761E